MKRIYYPQLNLVRFFLSVLIADFFHYALFMSFTTPFSSSSLLVSLAAYTGNHGVELFFLMSGFVAYLSDEKKMVKKELDFFSFIKKKILRLYPLMTVCTLVIWITQKVFFARYGYYLHPFSQGDRSLSLLVSLLGIQSGWFWDGSEMAVNEPSWYISVLMLCFFWFFLLTRWIKNEPLRLSLYGITATFGMVLMQLSPSLPFLYRISGRGYFGFFLGLLLGFFTTHMQKEEQRRPIQFCGLIAVTLYALVLRFDAHSEIWLCLFLHVGLLLALLYSDLLYKLCDNPVVSFLGEISFGIYLWNVPTIFLIRFFNNLFAWNLNYEGMTAFLLVLAANIGISILSHFIRRFVKTLYT